MPAAVPATAGQSSSPYTQTVPSAPARRIRVLIAASTLYIGGAERIIACLAGGLDRNRFDVSVCWLKDDGLTGSDMRANGIHVVGLPGRNPGGRDRLTSVKLRRFIREQQFDIVHTHDLHGLMDGVACRLLLPAVRHVHTFHFGNYPHLAWRYRTIERLLWRMPDALVAVGHAQAASLRSLYGISERRLHVIWNGVNPPTPRIAESLTASLADCTVPVIGSISTFVEQKGLHDLIRAAALLKARGTGFRLLLIGGGPMQESLEAEVRKLDLGDQVRFVGWVTEAADRALPACDIFVQSSLWEAMSVVVLEAMANGKAVVVTRVGENPYVIDDGKTGLTVPAADPHALAETLHRVLSDPALRTRLGDAARSRHAERFTIGHMVADYENLYARLVSSVALKAKHQ